MAYSFTVIPDYVFDQVLSFTNMNTLKDNQENIHDSYSEEHTFSDGIHKRITKHPNLLMNPTARRGNAFWWGAGAAADYDTGDPDEEYANAPNFGFVHWSGLTRTGPYWEHVPATAWVGDLSEKIYITTPVPIVLSAEIQVSGYVAGDMYIDVVCYDNTNQVLASAGDVNGLCQIKVSANTDVFDLFEAAGTTPANTEYIRIRKWVNAAADATVFRVQQIKVEGGTIATAYSDESSMVQYLSARYTTDTAQSIGAGATIVKFEDKVYDDPGTDRYNIATGIFTADRYMKLRVSSAIILEDSANWDAGELADLNIYKTPLGGAAANYAVLDAYFLIVTPAFNWIIALSGSTTIELNKGDTFDIRASQTSGAALTLTTVLPSLKCYLDIEEI